MNKYSRVRADINLDAVVYNFEQMKNNILESTKMIAVIKTDGYGHGAVPIARMIEHYEYIWGFAVATVEEAVVLRNNKISKPVLILGYTFSEHFETIVRLELRPTVFQLKTAELLSEEALRQGKILKIHLALDTGMTRIGLSDNSKSVGEVKAINELPGLELEGIFTHFAKADEQDKTNAREQQKRFVKFCSSLSEEGIEIPMKHCSNSAGIIELQDANMDAVRAGISIYGIYPSEEVIKENVKLQPAMQIKSHIVYIKEVEAGIPISYGGTYITNRKTKVATIPVGYGDGYPRGLSNKGWVLIHGKKAPILGRVCMDQFMVDVTDILNAHELDEVTLLGNDNGADLPVEELSALCGRFPYEFVCDIGKRVPRVYIHNGEIVLTRDCFNE